jgi:signal transduction histidine kinase
VGRRVYADRAAAARLLRYGSVMRDPATWRDLLWTAASIPLNVVGFVPAVIVSVGVFGLALQPLGWAPWAIPLGLSTGAWVTPWYLWYAVTYAVPGLAVIPGWVSPFIGLAIASLALPIAVPLLRLRARWDRWLLGPTRSAELAQRVQRLTQTRAEAVDAQAAELRRIERDLHDGAQARLVGVGLNLGAIERLIDTEPEAAKVLLAQTRESSATALTELRDLVRGIHPPVLAERGLVDAVRALALDTPVPVEVRADVPGRFDAPVESAAYFAVSEALANAIRHANARRVSIHITYDGGMLRAQVSDDGDGGADPDRGSGLRGIRRRLGTFDGTVALQSPPGGPTVVTMEIPCALSSPRTSTS